MEDTIDTFEIESREPFLVVSGRAVSLEGDITIGASAMVSDRLHICKNKTDTFEYRRLGKDSNKMLVKVPNFEDKMSLLKAARTIRPPNFYVNEFLSRRQDKLLFEMRKLKSERGFYSVFSFKGKIHYTLTKGGKMILVKDINNIR
jgi:hypothetical protein